MANPIYEVNVDGLRLRNSPNDGSVISVLPYGQAVEELGRKSGWSEVTTSVGGQAANGYVAKKYLRRLGNRLDSNIPRLAKPKVTSNRLRKFVGAASDESIKEIAENLDKTLSKFDINKNRKRLNHFLAQLSHESNGFTRLTENLNYSADTLWNVFRKDFSSESEAEKFAGDPQRIANRVYANRLGNGPEESGDGYRYRGRGLIQLTGKKNYAKYGEMLGLDLVENPELAAKPKNAVKIAGAYWRENDLNKLADKNDLKEITRRINGGYNGLQDRVRQYKKASSIWTRRADVTDDGRPKKNRSGLAASSTGTAGAGAAGGSATDVMEGESEQDVAKKPAPEKQVVEKTSQEDNIASETAPSTSDGKKQEEDECPESIEASEVLGASKAGQTQTTCPDKKKRSEPETQKVEKQVSDEGLISDVAPDNQTETWAMILGTIVFVLSVYIIWKRMAYE